MFFTELLTLSFLSNKVLACVTRVEDFEQAFPVLLDLLA